MRIHAGIINSGRRYKADSSAAILLESTILPARIRSGISEIGVLASSTSSSSSWGREDVVSPVAINPYMYSVEMLGAAQKPGNGSRCAAVWPASSWSSRKAASVGSSPGSMCPAGASSSTDCTAWRHCLTSSTCPSSVIGIKTTEFDCSITPRSSVGRSPSRTVSTRIFTRWSSYTCREATVLVVSIG